MKKRIAFPGMAFIFLAAILATTQSSSAVVADHGPSAFGQGEFVYFNGLRNEHWNYSFDTSANKNGQARGRATFDIVESSTQTQVIVKVDCLNVLDSSSASLTAIMTGTVLHSDNPDFPKRANVLFAAEDSNSIVVPDIITPLFLFPGGDCHDGALPLTFFMQNPGAIHIEP